MRDNLPDTVVISKVCSRCKIDKPVDSFYPHKRYKDGRNPWCNQCWAEYKATRYYQNHEKEKAYSKEQRKKHKAHRARHTQQRQSEFGRKIHEYFGCSCCICGFSKDWYECYDCHHLDPNTKLYNVANMLHKDWKTETIPEMDKCIYVCKRCHAALSRGRFDLDISAGKLVLIPGQRYFN
jgi:hypothetical protein